MFAGLTIRHFYLETISGHVPLQVLVAAQEAYGGYLRISTERGDSECLFGPGHDYGVDVLTL